MLKFYKKVFYLFIFLIAFFSAQMVYAAELNLSPSSGSYKVGDNISVRVVLSSPGDSANAVSGTLSFSKDILTLNSISKSNSLVSLWAVEPTYSNSNGTANLEGIILNGYTGSNGTIVTMSFKAKSTGNANIRFISSSVLANDGLGTNILTGTGQANFSIAKVIEKTAPVVTTPIEEEKKETSNIYIQELKKKAEIDSTTRFLITSIGKKPKTNYRVEIDGSFVSWEKQDSGIFETPVLKKGSHTFRVSMDTVENTIISSSTNFNITGILVPVFTEYNENLKEKEYIVVKGLADPNTEIIMNLKAVLNKGNEILDKETSIKSDDKGLFTYVSDKAIAGIYDVTAVARTKDGSLSDKSTSIKVNVREESLPFATTIVNTFSLLVPIVAVIILLLLLAIWGWYKVLHFKDHSKKKLLHARSMVVKSFDILDEDVNEQVRILKKIKTLQPLTAEERTFMNQFKKDIESAEKIIIDEIKQSEK